jgi:hypothetical protein
MRDYYPRSPEAPYQRIPDGDGKHRVAILEPITVKGRRCIKGNLLFLLEPG